MRLPVRAAALLALTLLLSQPARADEGVEESASGSSDDAERPVSIGARRPRAPFSSPRRVEGKTFDRLASTAAALVDGLPGVIIFESMPLGGTPVMRGLAGRRAAMLVDGMRLESSLTPLGGEDLLGVLDPLALERAEILLGPGGVAYGSGAVGGAIDLIRPHLLPDPRVAWDAAGNLRSAFDSGRLAALGRLAGTTQVRGLGLRAGAGLRRLGDLQSGRGGGREPFTSALDGSAEVEAGWAPRRGRELRLGYQLLRQPDTPRPDRSVWNGFQVLDRDRDEVRLDYQAEEMGRWLSSLRATIRYRHLRYRGDLYHLRDDIIEQWRERLASLDAQLGLVTEISLHRLSYGVDLGHDWLASSKLMEQISSGARELLLSALHPDGSRAMQLEAFVLDEITVGRRMVVEAGARAGVADLAVAARQQPAVPASERAFGAYASALHARYLLGDGLNVVAGVVQGFLAPNLDDLAAAGCHERGYRQPSPKLAPEKSVTGELGVKLDLYGVLSATLFYGYTQLFDAILEVPLRSVWVTCGGASAVPLMILENGSAGVHSVDASLQLEFTRWKLHSWLSWARGDSTVEGRGTAPLERVPPLTGYAAGRYQFSWARSFLELALRWAAPQDQLGPADRLDPRLCVNPGGSCAGSQSYFYVSLRGGMELLRWLRLQLALENLTHERYRLHAAGVPAPGFSALFGLEASAP